MKKVFVLCKEITNSPLFFNLFFAINFSYLVIMPDDILAFLLPNYKVSFDPLFLLTMSGAGLLISFNRSKTFFFLLMLTLCSLQIIQISNIVYFGYPISPTEIFKIYSEFSDIAAAGIGDAEYLWMVPVAAIFPFLLIIALYLSTTEKMFKFPYAFILVLALFIPKIERATRKDLKHFLPSPIRYSLHNTINTFSFFVGNEMWTTGHFSVPNNFYKPYAIQKISSDTKNIVLIIGESVNLNHMSIFGYGRGTTPFLSSLKGNNKFHYQQAIAGGVSTHTSIAFFFNTLREPGNIRQMKDKTTNLFRLAKAQGFSTFFLSAQDAKNAYDIGAQYIDVILTKEEKPLLFKNKRDDALIDLLSQLQFGEKNFIVIQMRTPHASYEDNYDKGSEFDVFHTGNETTKTDEYDNAMLYADHVIKDIFSFFKDTFKKNSYFIFTSDHGQVMGEKGFWGHNKLDISVAEIPFLYYSTEGGKMGADRPSHYEIGEWLASLLGYRIINPNMEKDIFFIHGNNFLSDYEFIKYRKEKGSPISQETDFLKDYVNKTNRD